MKFCSLGWAFTLAILLIGCDSGGEKKTRRVIAPGNAYSILVETTDLGACCRSRIEGHLEGFDGTDTRSELFEIEGSNDLSLQWNGPYNLMIQTCNATEIHHRSGIWKKDVSAKLFVSIINGQGEKTSDGIECKASGAAISSRSFRIPPSEPSSTRRG